MPYSNWREAAEILRRAVDGVDDEQRDLAENLGIVLPSVPGRIAAAILREALAEPLRLDRQTEPRFGQMEFLADIVEEIDGVEVDGLVPLATANQASAWIDVMLARRALRALEELEPTAGDVVRGGRDDRLGIVSSISGDGRVNLRGLWGRGLDPHRLSVVARATDLSDEADGLRAEAENLAAQRARIDGPPSEAKLRILAENLVGNAPDKAEIELLREAIEDAEDEGLIQQCLQEHPDLLGALTNSQFGPFIRSQVRLGAELVPDFVMAVGDSAGLHWTLVELESPMAPTAIQEGQRQSQKLREAIQQIEDWREWLTNNLGYARRAPSESGLGLVDIRPQSPGLILIGRRGHLPALNADRLRRLGEQQLAVHSYDWLLEAIEAGHQGIGSALDRPEWMVRF
jgi:hypothetical protein